jgi:hypothetical protein
MAAAGLIGSMGRTLAGCAGAVLVSVVFALASEMGISAIGISAVDASAIAASSALALIALASAILASISFAMALGESSGATVLVDGGGAGGAGLGAAGCAGVAGRSPPPHMPQKRLVSGFEFPQRGQRTVCPPP